MSSIKSQKPARAHHWVPRHYLKGFASQSDATRVWVYERGKPFNPGHQPRHHHPLHAPIKKTAMTVDFYACRQQDGTVDYETYEKVLSAKENSDALLLAKMRQGKMLSEPEKRRFAAYMLLMSRRTPAHQSQFPFTWSSVINEMQADSPLLRGFEVLRSETPASDVEMHAKIAAWMKQYDDVLAQKSKEEPPDDVRLDAMFNDSDLVVDILTEMNWHILSAPQGCGFLAADDPVYLRSGLQHAKSEVVFPLSTKLALVAVWDFQESLEFEEADRSQVELVNRAMMSIAQNNIFYFQKSSSLATLFNTSEYRAIAN